MERITIKHTLLQSKTSKLKIRVKGHKDTYTGEEIRKAIENMKIWNPEQYLKKSDEWLEGNFI